MTVLVTGARGFIGSHVVHALEARGVDVSTLVRPVDYHDADAVMRLLDEVAPTVLIHCAWRLAPGNAYLTDPANEADIGASLALFRLAREAGCRRIVGVGTCLEYEQSDGPVGEDAPLAPTTPYGQSKAELFRAAAAWAQTAGASFAWARLYFAYGPREAPHRLVPSVVNGLLRGQRVATTSGAQLRSFIYAADAGDAIAAIALSEVDGAVNVGTETPIPVRDVVRRIGELVGRPELLDVGALTPRAGEPAVLCPDVRKLWSLVKWRPSRDLERGLEETIAWWRARR